jgi:hypothetical protein
MLDGKVIGECLPRRRAVEFIRFLRRIDRETHPVRRQPTTTMTVKRPLTALKVASKVIRDDAPRWELSRVGDFLDGVLRADPSLEGDDDYRRLRELLEPS